MVLRLSEYDEWKENNPQWERYHSSASAPMRTCNWRQVYHGDVLPYGKDWEKHLTNMIMLQMKKASGKDNTINV